MFCFKRVLCAVSESWAIDVCSRFGKMDKGPKNRRANTLGLLAVPPMEIAADQQGTICAQIRAAS
jgi:hypothetical protein